MSTQAISTAPDERLVLIAVAADRLGRSVWTLKRWYKAGWLPAVIGGGQWSVPESYIRAVLASPRPRQAGNVADIATTWFADHADTAGRVA